MTSPRLDTITSMVSGVPTSPQKNYCISKAYSLDSPKTVKKASTGSALEPTLQLTIPPSVLFVERNVTVLVTMKRPLSSLLVFLVTLCSSPDSRRISTPSS